LAAGGRGRAVLFLDGGGGFFAQWKCVLSV
jgi:hypothetical protein